jgi:hypothetical protein
MLTYGTETLVPSGERNDGQAEPTVSMMPAGRQAHGWLTTALAYLGLTAALMAAAVAAVKLGFLA